MLLSQTPLFIMFFTYFQVSTQPQQSTPVPPRPPSPPVPPSSAGEKRTASENDAAPSPKHQKPDNTQPSVSQLFLRTTHDHKQNF